ncbi:MAG: tRNA epoxyqueuosine(34) reductase QueG [Phycisphaerae bacterium]|nr:tRNA epoxyqueuosine(34) reductase QueG [Phycisphaerae bacterium]
MGPQELRTTVLRLAARAGFDLCGIAPAEPHARGDYLRAWLAAGRAGSMDYLHRNLESRLDPRELLDGARSVIVTAMNYHQPQAAFNPNDSTDARPRGRVARYAWGEDYHRILKDRLFDLVHSLEQALPSPFRFRVCVDTAPIIERELAARAGLGWIGKNTMVLSRRLGSYFFIGEVLTDLDIAADEPASDHCGACTACLDACPTAAFPAPYEMDASRCISYLTIEHRGAIDDSLAALTGDWLFGCDVCQEVCPYNREAPATIDPQLAARHPAPDVDLQEVLAWTPDDYRRHLRGRAMKRAKLDMLQRNARIALDNSGA